MLIRGKVSTLLQIFCELSLYTQVIFKSMRIADDTFQSTSECEWVNIVVLTYASHTRGIMTHLHKPVHLPAIRQKQLIKPQKYCIKLV